MDDEPFGRQPGPVSITITGDPIDVEYWTRHFTRSAEFKGDITQRVPNSSANYVSFNIYPRAVND